MNKDDIWLGDVSCQLRPGVGEDLVGGVEIEGIAFVVIPIAIFDRSDEFNWVSIIVKQTFDGSTVGVTTGLVVTVCDGVSEGENAKGSSVGRSEATEQPDKEVKEHFWLVRRIS